MASPSLRSASVWSPARSLAAPSASGWASRACSGWEPSPSARACWCSAGSTASVRAWLAYVVFGFAQGPVNVAITPLVLHVTPRALVGRAVAVLEPATMLASVVSLVLAGLAVSTVLRGFHTVVLGFAFGPVDTIYTVMGLLTILAGVYAARGLRGVELPRVAEDAAPAEGSGALRRLRARGNQ